MTQATKEPTRARAVLSTQDFKLLQQAVLFYLKAHEEDPGVAPFMHLYHRLGTAAAR
jgi:hypothetical protein